MNCVRKLEKYVGSELFNIRPMIEMIAAASFSESTLTIDPSSEMIHKYGEVISEYRRHC